MKTYPKIDTLYERSEKDFKVLTGVFRRPEFYQVNKWMITEKVDGTNIRVRFDADSEQFEFNGRSDKAEIPKELMAVLGATFLPKKDEFVQYLSDWNLDSITLFGEGYGPKIQNGGLYRNDPGFIGFDVLVNDTTWLHFDAMESTFRHFMLQPVPLLAADASVDFAYGLCFDGFPSRLSDKVRVCEGVVARPRYNLYDQRGSRVMWKLKNTDFHNPESRL